MSNVLRALESHILTKVSPLFYLEILFALNSLLLTDPRCAAAVQNVKYPVSNWNNRRLVSTMIHHDPD